MKTGSFVTFISGVGGIFSERSSKLFPIRVESKPHLTLEVPITTAADDIHKYFFIVFQRK